MPKPRNLVTVIDQLKACAPDLAENLERVKNNIRYTAPEIMADRWLECAEVLNASAQDHPKADELHKIFSGA